MEYAVIMAGGAGKRLWPLSRLSRPKQLLPLVNGKNLMEIAVERLEGLFPVENIIIITNAEYADQVAAALPQLDPENIIGEPMGRDTANAIALAAEIVAGRDEDATMAIFTADHVIKPIPQFAETVLLAMKTAGEHPDALLTFGINPTYPHTGLGYIHGGDQIADHVRKVKGFKEKPDHQVARRYVESGQYYWNSGMFVWKLSAIRDALGKFLPDSMEKLAPIAPAVRDGRDIGGILAEVYPQLEKISIDYAVMEKAEKVLVVELSCDWVDVGSWPALENVTELDDAGNIVTAENSAVLDSFRNIIISEDGHMLAVLGMDDCIVIHSKDATLVCNKADSQRLKELVEFIEEKFGDKYI